MAGSSKSLGPAWRLSTTLHGHSMDVRAVGTTPEGCIVSGSRDRTAKLWHPTGVRDFSTVVTYKGHDNFVSSVCFLPPCNAYPEGLIITASNDKTICGYNIEDPMPVVVLKGHENTVCCVTAGHIPGIILSSSWDSTGRVWSVEKPEKSLQILKGHQAVIWGILELGNHNIATASADKTIFIWTPDGKKIKTLTGHTDCVRDLTVASPETFLSCANDASIRLWTNHGECINTFFGHTNYIYSICSNPSVDNQCFVTSGEDSTVRVWSGGDNICTITLPAQSVWSVACMNNGDIVAGSSDGLVRVFTRDNNRQADALTLKQFEEEVVKLHEASAQEIGGVKVTDLPGPEVLFEPGKTDGQTKLVRTGTKVKCYSWDATNQKWNEIGDVMGSAGPTEGKTAYQGKEYDFVFSVDIEDGKPPLKLPYNMNEDPWNAAQIFIHKNLLPQSYLEQVANFIITNSNKGNNEPVRDNNYMDPFTGGSRYMPTSNQSANTKSNGNASLPPTQDKGSSAFPQKTYLRFDKADYSVILEKLKEFNRKLPDRIFQVSDADLEAIIALAGQKSTYNPEIANKLKRIITWPQELLFPALDATRLTIRNEYVNKDLFDSEDFGPIIMRILLENLGPGNLPANQLLTLRVLVNAFAHKQGESLVLKEHESILNILICLENFNKNVQIAIATLLLNLSVALGKESNSIILCQCLLEISTKFSENEAHFRTLVALGTLITLAPTKTDITTIISMHSAFMKQLQQYTTLMNDSDLMKQKVAGYSKQILQLL